MLDRRISSNGVPTDGTEFRKLAAVGSRFRRSRAMSTTMSKQAAELARPDDWQAPPSPGTFQAAPAAGSKGARLVRRIAWNLLPPLTFAAMVGLWWGAVRGLQDPSLPVAGARGRVRTHRDRRRHAVEPLQGHADRDPARLRAHHRDVHPARLAHRAVGACEADRLSADHADAARSEDRGGATLPGVAGIRASSRRSCSRS